MSDTIVLALENPESGAPGRDAGDIEFDPLLVEQAVFLAIPGTVYEKDFHATREVCYLETDPERRDHDFLHLEREWFVKLDLARPTTDALAEWPAILSRVQRCILAPSLRRRDECAELYGNHALNGPKLNLLIRLDAGLFTKPAQMRAFLRHELMHINDMLDPDFDYDPSLGQFLDDSGIPNATRDRYRLLWDVSIDGRLSARYGTAIAPQTRNEIEFGKRFRVLGPRIAEAFNWILNAPTLTHPEILTFARTPVALLQTIDLGRASTAS